MSHNLECDDPDCACHDWRSEVEEQLYAQHCDAPQECPDGCPWCIADAEREKEAKVFNRLFGGWRK